MEKFLAIVGFIGAFVIMAFTFPDGVGAVILLVTSSVAAVLLIRRFVDEKDFAVQIFLLALFARVLLATLSHVFNFKEALGGDQFTYDEWASQLVNMWTGGNYGDSVLTYRAINSSGWGMNYFTAAIYLIFGRNMLAAQFLCSVIGAATAPLIYVCAMELYRNRRVARYSAILVAFFPGFIVWSSQLFKDGLIIFLLVMSMIAVLKLQKKMNYWLVLILALSMFSILSLRFYIFFIVAVSVAGTLIIGTESSIKTIVRGFASMVAIGVLLTYFGAMQNAGSTLQEFGSLERLQASRLDNAKSANSGFNDDVDISTPMGALQAFPTGFAYLMLAPFPWQMANFRQLITLPEMLVWWASIPLMISGLWFTIKNRLRNSIAILLFTVLLTIGYSVTQGNVGTAYRQRTQIQVFLFIFISVGASLMLERRENKKLKQGTRKLP